MSITDIEKQLEFLFEHGKNEEIRKLARKELLSGNKSIAVISFLATIYFEFSDEKYEPRGNILTKYASIITLIRN